MSLKNKNASEMTAFELMVGMIAQGMAACGRLKSDEIGQFALRAAEVIEDGLPEED